MNRRQFILRGSMLSCAALSYALPNAVHAVGASGAVGSGATLIPAGYIQTGQAESVPPLILYGVALQESAQLFGNRVLPYPWTLNVAGAPHRFTNFNAAVAALRANVMRGITSVDCGLMQVNWRYHNEKLGNFQQALDPYPNLRAGALILRQAYARTGDWFKAVGHYHSPENPVRANAYAHGVVRRMKKVMHG